MFYNKKSYVAEGKFFLVVLTLFYAPFVHSFATKKHLLFASAFLFYPLLSVLNNPICSLGVGFCG